MYYNKILGKWMIDQIEYFLITTIVGTITGSSVKKYLSKKKAIKTAKKIDY